jgi:hypothetical protein
MVKKYRVRMREIRYFYVDVEAEDEYDARNKVDNMNLKDKDWIPEDKEEDICWEESDTYELGEGNEST